MNSDIEINVNLDEEGVPQNIQWKAKQGPSDDWLDSKAMMISFFDEKSKDTLRIDLWTKEMEVMEMDRFFYHTLKSMVDTYKKATNNTELCGDMQSFVHHFGKQTGILAKD